MEIQQELPSGWLRARDNLLQDIAPCLRNPGARRVNLSVPKHTAIVLALHSLVYDGSKNIRLLPVTFNDGSQPPPFPLPGWEQRALPAAEPGRTFRVGLMSMRHPELDYLVDLYVCRNISLARCETMAEEELEACSRSIELLLDPALKDGDTIEVFHTGLEPMVVGFYRGVVSVLYHFAKIGKGTRFTIRPRLFAVKGTREDLSPQSPGARPENYVPAPVWS